MDIREWYPSSRSGKIKALISLLMQGVGAREAWVKAMDIQTGKYFTEGVKNAVTDYKLQHPTPKATIHISGYDKFIEAKKWKEEHK